MRKYLPGIAAFLLLIFINFVIGCSPHNYQVTTAETSVPLIEKMQMNKKYFIVHQGTEAWHMKEVSLNEDKTAIHGVFEELPAEHLNYLDTKPQGTNPYKPDRKRPVEDQPVVEVHFYISEYAEGQNNQVTIALPAVKKIEIYDVDHGANTVADVFTVVGVMVGIIVMVGVIVALTKSSCPLVYINDNGSSDFVGEMYGGAIFSSLERNDFMPLPGLIPNNGEYQIRITNELLERQYTNLAELVMVEHAEDSKVILDKNGNIQTIQCPELPVKAISDGNKDYSDALLMKDSSAYTFNDANLNNKDFSNLTLSFKKPLHSKTGKLVLNAKNSYWLDYIYGKFNEQFGIYYNKYAEMQKTIPGKKITQWSLNQGIPLSVYLETENGWEFVDYFDVMGPLASRDLIMPIDLSAMKGENVKLKLECGFMFWEIDYAAMDFSENIPVQVAHLTPTSAVDEYGIDVSSQIAAVDTAYLVQPKVGNEVTLKYTAPANQENKLQSFFLSSRGYYEYIRDYQGVPDILYLYSFKKKGAFTRYAKQQYDDLSIVKDSLEFVFSN